MGLYLEQLGLRLFETLTPRFLVLEPRQGQLALLGGFALGTQRPAIRVKSAAVRPLRVLRSPSQTLFADLPTFELPRGEACLTETRDKICLKQQ